MSIVLNMVGGGAGLNPNNALIHVNAPLGSTVTFAKGGVTVKTILPAKAFTNEDDETADYYYSVTSSNYGTWTTTASLNGKTKSNTVSVSTNEQYDVILKYRYEIFADGKIVNMPTLYSADGVNKGTLSEESAGGINFVRWYRKFSTYTIAAAYITLDLTNYTKVVADIFGLTNYRYGTQANTPAICVGASPFSGESGGTWNNVSAYTLFQTNTGRFNLMTPTSFTVDVSGITGTKCVFLSMGGTTNEDTYQNVANFYVE